MRRLLFVFAAVAAPAAAQTGPKVGPSQADLPQHTYAIGPSASALLTNRPAFDSLAVRLRAAFKAHGVRVVNMSWVENVSTWENALEAHGVGADTAQRKRLAAAMFGVRSTGLKAALASAPEILFVTAADNNGADSGVEDYPSSIDAPNVLTVGAVDRAGDASANPAIDGHRPLIHPQRAAARVRLETNTEQNSQGAILWLGRVTVGGGNARQSMRIAKLQGKRTTH